MVAWKSVVTICIVALVIAARGPLAAQAQDLPLIPDSVDDLVPTSPKPAWSDLATAVTDPEETWWDEILLYIPNRILDLLDVFRIDVGVGASFGAVVRVTEYGQVGYRQMMPMSFRVGDFGRRLPMMLETSNEFGVGPLYVPSSDREVCPAEIGVGADAFVVGAYGGICLDEVVDFVAGIFLVDLKEDDYRS